MRGCAEVGFTIVRPRFSGINGKSASSSSDMAARAGCCSGSVSIGFCRIGRLKKNFIRDMVVSFAFRAEAIFGSVAVERLYDSEA
jgi:hypothetical protein